MLDEKKDESDRYKYFENLMRAALLDIDETKDLKKVDLV